MRKLYVLAIAVAVALFATPAFAQEGGGGGGDAAGGGGGGDEDTTTYDFDDDLVTGDLVRPDGEMLNVRKRGDRASLIQIREHFIPEMLKSVEDL